MPVTSPPLSVRIPLAMRCRGVERWIIPCFGVGASRLDGIEQVQQSRIDRASLSSLTVTSVSPRSSALIALSSACLPFAGANQAASGATFSGLLRPPPSGRTRE